MTTTQRVREDRGPATRMPTEPAAGGRTAAWSRVVAIDAALSGRLDRTWPRIGLCAALTALFGVAAALRLYPFVDDVNRTTSLWDDWLSYKERALSILHDGLTMPIIPGRYFPPRGFLYNYFVAAVFWSVGENSAYVYLVQAALLGASIGILYLTFRTRLPRGGGVVYLAVLVASLSIDVFWKYTVRLLSENLALFWVAVLFPTFLAALARRRIREATLAGFVLGLATLSRPNLVVLGPALGLYLGVTGARAGWRRGWVPVVVFLVAFGAVLSLAVLRDYVVTGEFVLSPITDTSGWEEKPPVTLDGPPTPAGIVRAAWAYALFFGRRLLYALGFLFVLDAKYPLAPHWIVMWCGVGAFVWERLRRRQLEDWEAIVLLYVMLYLPAPLLVSINNYGARMLLLLVPLTWLLAVAWGAGWLGRCATGAGAMREVARTAGR